MRKLLQRVQQQIRDFVEQRDDLVLVAACSDGDTPMALKILRDIEQGGGGDMFLLFGDAFNDAPSYVDIIIERLRAEHCLADEALSAEGEEGLAQMPETLFDETKPPAQRLLEAILFARSLVPHESGELLIWALCPVSIADREEYLKLITGLIPYWGVQPWMRQGIRLIFRDLSLAETVGADLSEAPRTRLLPLDLGPEALAESLDQEVDDESLPLEQRMQSLLMLATQDFGYGRTADALTKYDLLLGHYQNTKDARMQAVTINGIGDVYQREEQLDKARQWYESAVPLATESEDAVILYTVVMNLGDVTYKQQDFAVAEECYDGGDKLAAKMGNPEAKVVALERRGLSREQQGAHDKAVESWEGAVQLCRAIGDMDHFLKQNLAHLDRGYEKVQQPDKQAAARAELEGMESEEKA